MLFTLETEIDINLFCVTFWCFHTVRFIKTKRNCLTYNGSVVRKCWCCSATVIREHFHLRIIFQFDVEQEFLFYYSFFKHAGSCKFAFV